MRPTPFQLSVLESVTAMPDRSLRGRRTMGGLGLGKIGVYSKSLRLFVKTLSVDSIISMKRRGLIEEKAPNDTPDDAFCIWELTEEGRRFGKAAQTRQSRR